MNIQSVSLDQIDVGERLRGIDADYVAWLADNLKQNGLLQPILVRQGEGTRLTLIDGGHRLAAARAIGLPRIEAKVMEGDDETAEILEIDANLVRVDLSPLDRAVFLGRRQSIFWAQHPNTKRGKAGAMARWHGMDTVSFAEEVSEKLGISSRTIRRATLVSNGLKPELRQRLANTWLAQDQKQLLALAKLDADAQRRVVDLLLHPVQPRKNVGEALAELLGRAKPVIAPDDLQYRTLMGAWAKAGKAARQQFIDHLVNSGEMNAVAAPKGKKS